VLRYSDDTVFARHEIGERPVDRMRPSAAEGYDDLWEYAVLSALRLSRDPGVRS
jgi:hypothetical protein